MYIAVDFDGTVVEMAPGPLRLVPGAREGLASLKRAGHVLLLWSARASRALLEDPSLDPLVRAGARAVDPVAWRRGLEERLRRHAEMVEFVGRELPGVFDAIDDGLGGKPDVDCFIDDRAIRLGRGPSSVAWRQIARWYGEPVYGTAIRGLR